MPTTLAAIADAIKLKPHDEQLLAVHHFFDRHHRKRTMCAELIDHLDDEVKIKVYNHLFHFGPYESIIAEVINPATLRTNADLHEGKHRAKRLQMLCKHYPAYKGGAKLFAESLAQLAPSTAIKMWVAFAKELDPKQLAAVKKLDAHKAIVARLSKLDPGARSGYQSMLDNAFGRIAEAPADVLDLIDNFNPDQDAESKETEGPEAQAE